MKKYFEQQQKKAGNLIEPGGAHALSEALMVNTSLTTLEMERAQPTKQQGISKQAIYDNSYAQTDNRFGSEGTSALGEALKVNATLTTLNMRGVQQQQYVPKP